MTYSILANLFPLENKDPPQTVNVFITSEIEVSLEAAYRVVAILYRNRLVAVGNVQVNEIVEQGVTGR